MEAQWFSSMFARSRPTLQRVPVTPLAAGDAFSVDYAILRRTILRQGFL